MDTGVTLGIIGIILSLVALIMAVSPLAQMLWGRPKLSFEFTEFTGSDGKNLIFTVRNKPVDSAFLRSIGVRRETGEINASINIYRQGTTQIVQMQIPAMINDPVKRNIDYVAHCRPHFHAAFAVIHCVPQGPSLYDPRQEAYITLPSGLYDAVIQVVCGDQCYQNKKLFRADSDPTNTNWL